VTVGRLVDKEDASNQQTKYPNKATRTGDLALTTGAQSFFALGI